MTPRPSESAIQRAFVDWCRWNEGKYPQLKLAFAVPNGGLRNVITATRMKREGVKAGVSDWLLPVPTWLRGGPPADVKTGLAIEFKKPGGRMTKEQKAWSSLARQYGWRVEICTSADEAISLVKEYLS